MAAPSNTSTTSLQSTTSTLITGSGSGTSSAQRRVLPGPQKDYAGALAVLQSRYGYGSGGATMPSPKLGASKKLPPDSTSSTLTPPPSLFASSSRSYTGFASEPTLAISRAPAHTAETTRSSSASVGGEKPKKKIATRFAMLKSLFKGKRPPPK